MSVKERILAIRLMEKLQSRPEFAKALGIEVCGEIAPPGAAEKKEKGKWAWDLDLTISGFPVLELALRSSRSCLHWSL